MILLADECIENSLVAALRHDGLAVEYIPELIPGASDQDVLEYARSKKAILLTADKDFGEIVFRQGKASQGVVLVRLHGLSPREKHRIVSDCIQVHGQEMLCRFTVITSSTVRIGKRLEGEEG